MSQLYAESKAHRKSREKRQRILLFKRMGLYAAGIFQGVLSVGTGIVAALIGAAVIMNLVSWNRDMWSLGQACFTGALMVTVVGIVSIAAGRQSRNSLMMAQSISMVAPVKDTTSDAPAREMLLRGSTQPAAWPGELLRAAKAGKAEPSEELLRAGQRNIKV